jgi:PAS domain S-box-containing protein/putative nucleotidyltransferase with HDIG domain
MKEGYHEVDLRGSFTFFNKSFQKLMGYPHEELMGMNYRQYAADDANRKNVFEAYNRVFRTGEPLDSFEWDIVLKDGDRKTVEVSASLITDKDNQPIGFRGLVRDITERKQAEDDLKHSVVRMRKTLGATVQAISSLVETRDPYTAGHQRRVSDLARAIATEMGLPTDQIDGIRMAAIIHDIGKMSVPAEILSMPRKLTDIEFSLIKTHALSGYDILKDIEFPWPVGQIILQHHEMMDGSGYPNGLKGSEILLEARILTVADVVEAMASHRPYRAGLGLDAALEEITKNRGVLYDPKVVDACLRLFNEKGYKLTD